MAKKSIDEAMDKSTDNVDKTTAQSHKKRITEQRKIYVGASIPGLPSNTVIIGEEPKILDNKMLKQLFINVDELPAFMKAKRIEGTKENLTYKKSLEIAKEMRENA